jgi:hypothetical protein
LFRLAAAARLDDDALNAAFRRCTLVVSGNLIGMGLAGKQCHDSGRDRSSVETKTSG